MSGKNMNNKREIEVCFNKYIVGVIDEILAEFGKDWCDVSFSTIEGIAQSIDQTIADVKDGTYDATS